MALPLCCKLGPRPVRIDVDELRNPFSSSGRQWCCIAARSLCQFFASRIDLCRRRYPASP